ncbi:serine/arginine repetitive matrix protein 1-like [Penaeus japonicus]|uniref:serine/arginine repetitive matrix protein 1-like n=1 Tax=Penaeus japonicus TaxID=27405 RepID=UPI001C70F39D|nr:serine/arginine repetitive matrix protein 1-like [Penaeus japonicus]
MEEEIMEMRGLRSGGDMRNGRGDIGRGKKSGIDRRIGERSKWKIREHSKSMKKGGVRCHGGRKSKSGSGGMYKVEEKITGVEEFRLVFPRRSAVHHETLATSCNLREILPNHSKKTSVVISWPPDAVQDGLGTFARFCRHEYPMRTIKTMMGSYSRYSHLLIMGVLMQFVEVQTSVETSHVPSLQQTSSLQTSLQHTASVEESLLAADTMIQQVIDVEFLKTRKVKPREREETDREEKEERREKTKEKDKEKDVREKRDEQGGVKEDTKEDQEAYLPQESRQFTGVGRPTSLLPPDSIRRRRLTPSRSNRTRVFPSNLSAFARDSTPAVFNRSPPSPRRSKHKSLSQLLLQERTEVRQEREGDVTFAPPVYKPGPAVVKFAPDLDDLRKAGLVGQLEMKKVTKGKTIEDGEISERIQRQGRKRKSEIGTIIPDYISSTTFKPKFLYKDVGTQNKKISTYDDVSEEMALFVESAHNPTYSLSPQALHGHRPLRPQNLQIRQYNLSAPGRDPNFSITTATLLRPQFLGRRLSPTASSFIPPAGRSGVPRTSPKSLRPLVIVATPRPALTPRTYTLDSKTPKPLTSTRPFRTFNVRPREGVDLLLTSPAPPPPFHEPATLSPPPFSSLPTPPPADKYVPPPPRLPPHQLPSHGLTPPQEESIFPPLPSSHSGESYSPPPPPFPSPSPLPPVPPPSLPPRPRPPPTPPNSTPLRVYDTPRFSHAHRAPVLPTITPIPLFPTGAPVSLAPTIIPLRRPLPVVPTRTPVSAPVSPVAPVAPGLAYESPVYASTPPPPKRPSFYESVGGIPGVPGTPHKDFPMYATIPDTTFSCNGRLTGYYADPEARCQVFHMCQYSSQKSSFLCPNGTIFNQLILTCDHWRNVDCEKAPILYDVNKKLYQGVQKKDRYHYKRNVNQKDSEPQKALKTNGHQIPHAHSATPTEGFRLETQMNRITPAIVCSLPLWTKLAGFNYDVKVMSSKPEKTI